MKIGDLPRAGTTAGSRGNLSVWAFAFLLASSVLVAGSLALPPSEQPDESVDAKEQTERLARGWSQPAPAQDRAPRAPVQVANADPNPVEILDLAPAELDAEPEGTPAHTGSSRPIPQHEPLAQTAAPVTAPVPAEPAPIRAEPVPKPAAPASAPTRLAAATEPVAVAERSPTKQLVDLNAASVQELNSLRGGGMIGKAIVRRRPYTSVEDLVKKRVLSRSAYNRIKDQVTVR
ncbi:MAG TPA: helix-hairpin-helix domain-containing protein [Microvirga sp.]|nr:helix-hairpin-helix domain-containing protein [Microvirga sp.]